ncbi:MAG: rhodanese-like domain-containing protein, partial [Rhodospirillales bacterium]
GHVPDSKNLAFQEMLQTDNCMELKSANDLRKLFMERGIDPSQPIISSCGSGVTAAVLYFSLFLIGYDTVSVYDGSWTEWGSKEDTPVAKGPE